MELKGFKNVHIAAPVWIIGTGPSLNNLKRSDIGKGVVITLNRAIEKIEDLEVNNIVYSMQKDGSSPEFINCCPYKTCDKCPYDLPTPKRAVLLVHELESKECKPDYWPRLVFNNNDFDLEWNAFSALSAIKIAQHLGCNKFNFVSFDACVNNDSKTAFGTELSLYLQQAKVMKEFIKDLDHNFITPC